MRFFDLIAFKDMPSEALAKRLGYKAIYSTEEIEIIDSLRPIGEKRQIVRSENNEVASKALRQRDVIGLVPVNYSISKKLLETIKLEEKLLFIPIAGITCPEGGGRLPVLARVRSLVRNALLSQVNICLVSLAAEKECLLSSAQMIEIADFIGIDRGKARLALGALGGSI